MDSRTVPHHPAFRTKKVEPVDRRHSPRGTGRSLVPPVVMKETQFTLLGLFALVSLAAVCCAIAAAGAPVLGMLLFLTALSLRMAVFDFSWRGDLATVLVHLFGWLALILFMQWSLR